MRFSLSCTMCAVRMGLRHNNPASTRTHTDLDVSLFVVNQVSYQAIRYVVCAVGLRGLKFFAVFWMSPKIEFSDKTPEPRDPLVALVAAQQNNGTLPPKMELTQETWNSQENSLHS